MDLPADLRITITDVRRAGFCASGIRRWFEAQGWDFRAFLKDGMNAREAVADGDALAARAALTALERAHGGRR